MNTGVHKHCMLLELAYDLENHLIGLILCPSPFVLVT